MGLTSNLQFLVRNKLGSSFPDKDEANNFFIQYLGFDNKKHSRMRKVVHSDKCIRLFEQMCHFSN